MEKPTSSSLDHFQQLKPFVLKNTDYYLKRWNNYKKPFSYSGWNWAAFFLTPFWLSYRHMYGNLLIYYIYIFLSCNLTILSPMITYFHMEIPIPYAITFSLFFFLFIHLFFGWRGNASYLRYVHKMLRKHHFVPIYKKGASFVSGIFAPCILGILIIFSTYGTFQFFNHHFVPYGVFVIEEEIGTFTLADSIRLTEPTFRKYDVSVELFYHGKEKIGNDPFQVKLYYRENKDDDWQKIEERSYTFFTGNEVTLDLINGFDSLTKTGEYMVEVYVGKKRMGKEQFSIHL